MDNMEKMLVGTNVVPQNQKKTVWNNALY